MSARPGVIAPKTPPVLMLATEMTKATSCPLPLTPSPKREGNQTKMQSRRLLALPSNQHHQSLSQRPLGEGGRAQQGREGAAPWQPPLPNPSPLQGEGRVCANNLTTCRATLLMALLTK